MPPRKRTRGTKQLVQLEDDEASDEEVPRGGKKVRWEIGSHIVDDSGEKITELTDSDEEGPLEKTCLAAWCKHGYLGCAYYDPVKCILYVLEDTQESDHFDLTTMLLEQANPDVILTSSKADDDFMDTLRDHMDVTGGLFQIRPHKDFTPIKGRDRLLSLRLLSELPQTDIIHNSSSNVDAAPRNAYNFMKKRQNLDGDPTVKRWNALIRLSNFASVESSPLCMASIGALLDHIVRECAVNDPDNEDGLGVRDIEILSFDKVLQINSDALFSLQIFENESHASVHSDKTKEGLSLFGILNGTVTSLGRSLLRTWLLRPSLSLTTINQRHDAVECFLHSENIISAGVMHSHLKGIKNMPRILGVLKSGRAKISDWQGIVKFTFHSAMLRETLGEMHQVAQVEILEKLTCALDIACFQEIGRKVNEIIDWEESATSQRVCVRAHVDEELDNRKHVYHGIDSVLSNVAEQISETVPQDYATSLNVVYFPQLGFLICIPMREEWQMEAGIDVIDGWSFQFFSNAHVYFKSQEMHDMDIHIGDLYSTIVDREIEIIQGLLDEILVHDTAIGQACHVCAELDCLLSFAEASRMYDYRRPQMVEDNSFDIRQGRHPLHEQIVDTFVPNDAHLAGGAGLGTVFQGLDDLDSTGMAWQSVLLCTGANACGKSVYLKQIGCFVPAESARLGIVDRIFTRISTRESVSRVQSAFMIDLNQVSLALRNCTARSLVILDEFGKGTLSTDGAGLFCGVLKHLLERGTDCPKVLAATHFHDVFRMDLLDPQRTPIAFHHMQVMFTASNGSVLPDSTIDIITNITSSELRARRVGAGEKITYLYRVAEGLSLDSHAAKCAEMFGVPSRLVQRAQYVSHLLSNHELGRLLDENMTEKERLDLKDAEAVCRRFLAWDLDAREQEANAKIMLGRCLGQSAANDQNIEKH